MYNNAATNTLAVTGGVGSIYIGWWAVAAAVVGITILVIMRHQALRKRRLMLTGK
ncbi:hypothetical protein KI440_02700 [Candidatus Saccharibacteria bacterium TM7i]|nr:hypothetical protein KI440_02700 [Candidatus Saccharibacteria bacterium TM7i]